MIGSHLHAPAAGREKPQLRASSSGKAEQYGIGQWGCIVGGLWSGVGGYTASYWEVSFFFCCYLHRDCQQMQRRASHTECHSMPLLDYPACLAGPACICLSVLAVFDLWAVGTYSKPLRQFFSFAESNSNDSFSLPSASLYDMCFITLQCDGCVWWPSQTEDVLF